MPAASTPAVAELLRSGVPHTLHPYRHDPATTAYGDEVVSELGWDAARVYKTLVATVDGALVVGIVPVSTQLNLKAVAAAVAGKRAKMADVADAERSSGYVPGGISPLGQRTRLRTVLDASARRFDTIMVSAGKRGLQVEIAPTDLAAVTNAVVAPIATT
jgi:Cys-tRNA(Pro)/Cys-tRNA(Cys) deacylase